REIPEQQKVLRRMPRDRELDHLRTMIPKMRVMLDEAQRLETCESDWTESDLDAFAATREKFMRWLGFMQGVLYAEGIFTIDQMKEHNRPTTKTVLDAAANHTRKARLRK